MPFLPFYLSGHKKPKIVIVGGGYAGIAALTTFLRYTPDANITIVDPRENHLKITHLHETFRYPLQDFLVPFSILEERFGCIHVCASVSPDDYMLKQWQKDKILRLNGTELEFDYLLYTPGSAAIQMETAENIFDLHDFMRTPGSTLLDRLLDTEKRKHPISVIGGGPTGIQFLFEIAYFLRRRNANNTLRMVHTAERVLKQFPADFSSYTQARMADLDIEFFPDTRFHRQTHERIFLEEVATGRQFDLPSSASFLFPGKKPDKFLYANAFGQVLVENKALQNIFTAGDCSIYRSLGSRTMTAQAAVRKGKLAARNILRHSGTIPLMEPFLHRDLGYVVSLGPTDGVGWLALEGNVIGGLPALVIKEVVEAQYDLLLAGIDTYLV